MNISEKGHLLLQSVAMIVLLAAGLPEVAAASIELQTDNFESDIAGWSAAGAADTQVQWDGSKGFPDPGSLLLSTTTGPASESHKAVGQCLPAQADQIYSVQALMDPELGTRSGSCFALPVFFDQPGCQGEGSVTGTGNAVSEGGWQREIRSVPSFSTTQSVRIELVMTLSTGTGPASCNFDTVSLHEGRLEMPIPTLTPVGIALAWLAIGCVAVWRLRRAP